jgi:glucokinase
MRILALDIGGTEIKVGLVNENGEVLENKSCPTNAKNGGAALMAQVIGIVSEYQKIDRIGISSAGQIHPYTGVVVHATDNIPGWTGINIKKSIEDQFNIPTVVENDVNCSALGEAFYGAGKNSDSFLCLTYGTGIGGAIIENRKIYTGSSFSAGEFGHMITHFDGESCTCGGSGCYEAYASTSALCRAVSRGTGIEQISGREIFEHIEKDNKKVIGIVEEWIQEIVCGLVSLVHIFNPSTIILGGGIMEQSYITEKIEVSLKSKIMPNYQNVVVKKAELGNKAGILGAAHIALMQIEQK